LGRQSFTFCVSSARQLSSCFSFPRPNHPALTNCSREWLRRAGPRKWRCRTRRTGSAPCETACCTQRDVLHALGFLPAHEVVRTSVLAQRWRHVWRSVRRLHITCPFDGTCSNCRGDDSHKGRCVLIGGLSSTVNLKLTAYSRKVHILTSDFSMCSFVSLCQFPFFYLYIRFCNSAFMVTPSTVTLCQFPSFAPIPLCFSLCHVQ
jgi:hypothetical protein